MAKVADPPHDAVAPTRAAAAQSLPFWPHAIAVAAALIALGYATGRVRAPATPPEPTVSVPESRAVPATASRPAEPAPPEPQVNVPIFELATDAGPSPRRVEWPEGAALATFVLRLGDARPSGEYALRVRGQDRAIVLSAEGLKPMASATLTIAVPRRHLPRGRYVFELLAPGSKPDGAPLRSYAVEIG